MEYFETSQINSLKISILRNNIFNTYVVPNLLTRTIRIRITQLPITLGCQKKIRKLDGKAEAIFDSPFVIQSQAESMSKMVGAIRVRVTIWAGNGSERLVPFLYLPSKTAPTLLS